MFSFQKTHAMYLVVTVVNPVQVKKMKSEKMKPQEQITLEPYERDHAVVVGIYRPPPKAK